MKSMPVSISLVSRRKHACRFHQPFCFVSLFNRFLIEKALSQNTNMGNTSSMQSLISGGNCPIAPRWLRAWLPFIFFKIDSLEIPWYFLYVFSCWMLWCRFKQIKNFSERIVAYLWPHKTLVLPLLFTKEYLFSQLELNFLFSSDTSLLTLIFC